MGAGNVCMDKVCAKHVHMGIHKQYPHHLHTSCSTLVEPWWCGQHLKFCAAPCCMHVFCIGCLHLCSGGDAQPWGQWSGGATPHHPLGLSGGREGRHQHLHLQHACTRRWINFHAHIFFCGCCDMSAAAMLRCACAAPCWLCWSGWGCKNAGELI